MNLLSPCIDLTTLAKTFFQVRSHAQVPGVAGLDVTFKGPIFNMFSQRLREIEENGVVC